MKKWIFAIAFVMPFQLLAQYNFSALDARIDAMKKELGGFASVVVAKDGKVIYKKNLGEDFNERTQVQIASSSKWLTAAMVLALVDAGKLSLDDKVSQYIPDFTKYNKSYITIRHCLSHQTGIKQEPIKLAAFLLRKKYETLEQEVNEFVSKREIDYNPGEAFFYGNVGMNIAARVCEVVMKRGFEQIMGEKILRPLAMRSTNFSDENGNAPNPSGGAVSSSLDYTNFLTMILNKGMFNGKRVLSEASVEELIRSQTNNIPVKYTPKIAEGYTYSLGAWVQEKDAANKTFIISAPGLLGTWPMIDFCRQYSFVIVTKSLLTEQKREAYQQLIQLINDQIPVASCN